jgi:DNA adenine methylase
MLFRKEPSPVEVYNDLDSGLVDFFRVLRDPDLFDAFHRMCAMTPYSREEYNVCRKSWPDETDPVKRAWAWFVVAKMSFSGAFGRSWSFSRSTSARAMAGTVSKWLSTIDQLPQIHARLSRVQIEHYDFRKVFEIYASPETLFYCDPPYVHSTRSKDLPYAHEMTDADHEDLIEILLNLTGMAVVSGYASPVYDALDLAGWKRTEWQTACHAAGRTRGIGILGKGSAMVKQKRIESAWINPACAAKLD